MAKGVLLKPIEARQTINEIFLDKVADPLVLGSPVYFETVNPTKYERRKHDLPKRLELRWWMGRNLTSDALLAVRATMCPFPESESVMKVDFIIQEGLQGALCSVTSSSGLGIDYDTEILNEFQDFLKRAGAVVSNAVISHAETENLARSLRQD